MTDTETTLVQTTAQVRSSDIRFIQSSSSSLQTLSSLPTDQLIILFTPAIPSTDGHEDPFETLGRSFSKWHARVRHVPFVAKVGLTDLHVAWIRKSGAIVVVNCDPALLMNSKTNTNMPSQSKFTAQVAAVLRDNCGGSQVPLSSVCIGPSVVPPADTSGYDNVIVSCYYSKAAMEQSASMLMCQ
jgi:hypothetical protein